MALNSSSNIEYPNTTIVSSQQCASPLLPISLGPGTLTGFSAQSFCLPPCCVPCPPQGSPTSPSLTNADGRHILPSIRTILQSARLGEFDVVGVCGGVLYSLDGCLIPLSKVEVEKSICYGYGGGVGVLAYP